jgi:hypothetical protein
MNRPKPDGWKPKNTLPETTRLRIIHLYTHFPFPNYSKISRITGVSDNCVRNVVRAYLGKK